MSLSIEGDRRDIPRRRRSQVRDDEKKKFSEFVALNSYVSGSYDRAEDFQRLNDEANGISPSGQGHRLFYLALPPSVYQSVTKLISEHCRPKE